MVSGGSTPHGAARRRNPFYPTAIGWHRPRRHSKAAQHSAWETIQRSHAIANGCYVAVRTASAMKSFPAKGSNSGPKFRRRHAGEILSKASADAEETLIVPLDLRAVDVTRTHWPFLRDRRIDAYGDLTKRLID